MNNKHSDLTNTHFQVDNQVIKSVSSIELLGIQIVEKHYFNLHISKTCKSAAKQLNTLIRLKQFLSFHAKEDLIISYIISNFNYIISNFNYCPLVWLFVYVNFEASYKDLLSNRKKSTMSFRRLRTLFSNWKWMVVRFVITIS